MTAFRVNLPVVLVLLFIANLFSLGSVHLGAFFTYLYWFFSIFLVLNGLHLLISLVTLKYSQSFSTDHPQKNDVLYYYLYVTNQSPLPSACITIVSVNATPADEEAGTSYELFLKRGERWEITVPISCPYRGVYVVGLDRLVVSDLLGILRVGLTVWKRTFYVYPRLIPLDRRYIPNTSRNEILSGELSGNLEDTAYFSHLGEYRPGESVRHAYWRRFSATGVVHVKRYDRTAQPGIELYLDRRGGSLKAGGSKDVELRAEDISLELTLSLVQYFHSVRVPLTLHLSYSEVVEVLPDDMDVVDRLRKWFLNLKFDQPNSSAIFGADLGRVGGGSQGQGGGGLNGGRSSGGARVVISHTPDFELLETLVRGGGSCSFNVLYLNSTAYTPQEYSLIQDYVYSAYFSEREVFFIEEKDYL